MADLIFIGQNWEKNSKSQQNLVTQLLSQHRVIWISCTCLTSRHSFKEVIKKINHYFSVSDQTVEPVQYEQLFLHSVIQLSEINLPIIQSVNEKILTDKIKQLSLRYGFEKIVIFYTQSNLPYLSWLADTSTDIYFHSWHRSIKSSTMRAAKALAAKCLLTFTESTDSPIDFDDLSTIELSPGIDYPSLSVPAKHPDGFDNTRPVAGYFGKLTNKLNIELLIQAATALPNWQFIFAGEVKCKKGVLDELPNVQFLEVKPGCLASAYTQNWDVSLLPFIPEDLDHNDLILLQEYLATGTPIAATQHPYTCNYEQCISIQGSKELYSQTIQRALSDTSRQKLRQQMAKPESWQSKAVQLNDLIIHLTANQSLTNRQESLF